MKPTHLTCDYMVNPLGFDFDRPLMGWITQSEKVGGRQAAYQIAVYRDRDCAQLLFDTGRVQSDLCAGVPLDMPLAPRTEYTWRVRVWDDEGAASPWSEAARFETAKYGEPWQARWIGWNKEFPQLRRDFTVSGKVKSARAYACGVGLYALYLNGRRVGDEQLAPNFNAYDSWLQYQSYDITQLIVQGKNAVGCRLGNGYYKGRVSWPEIQAMFGQRRNIFGDRLAFLCEIRIGYEDGREEVIGTGEGWKAAKSPFLRAEIYDGEVYDARLQDDAWCRPESDISRWDTPDSLDIDMKLLTARKSVPVKIHERIPAVGIIHTPAHETVVDFGQNFAGWVRFETRAPAGAELVMQFGEALDREGNFYRDNMRTALAELRYIADGQRRVYRPSFTFYGFRYVKLTGWPQDIALSDFVGEALYSDMAQTGSFSCSDPRVNQLFQNSLWGQKSNFVDVPTDCPQRDERMGWTGDAQVFCATASLNMQADAFYRKYLYDLAVEQAKDGYVPVTVPNILRKTGVWQLPIAGWGDAATIIPWTLYLYYGDKAVLERQYPSMKAWVDFMQKSDTLGVDRYYGFHLGDWLAQDTKDPDNLFGLTPTDLIATAFYARSARILAKTAAVLGKEEDAKTYAGLADRVERAFRREFVSENGRVVSETQTAQALALYFDLLLPQQRQVAAQHLAQRIRMDKMFLTTGFLGTPYLCPALSDSGYNQYAYALLLQDECPSWLYEVKMGATTLWERWNSVRPDGSFGPVSMNSLNHYAFGAICEWLYRWVAGINPVEEQPGFQRILLRPMPNSLLGWAKAAVDTVWGRVESGWKLEGGRIELEFRIPFNATAQIVLPDAQGAEVLENGKPLPDGPILRGSGLWRYAYTPNGRTIGARVVPDEKPLI